MSVSILVGLVVVAAIMADFLLTTISIRHAGPMTTGIAKALDAVLRRTPDHGVLSRYQGPLILTAVATAWIGGLWLGWWAVFLGGTHAMTGPNGSAVGTGDALGFAGSAISTMGLGVVTPNEPIWHIAAVLASISGMVVLTLSVTFVLNITQIATQSRAFRRQLDRMKESMTRLPPDGRAQLVLSGDDTLVDTAELLAQLRSCFPLATYYDRCGSRDDVVRATREFLSALPGPGVTQNAVAAERLFLVRRAAEGLLPEGETG